MKKYNLWFISDKDLYQHTKDTVLKYRFSIDLKEFSKNIIDPIKLSFDSIVYNKEIEELINDEVMRQIDKSNNNHIWYFNQNIFKYIWEWRVVPEQGYDIVNEDKKIYVEMKNKHNTMNSSSSQKTFMRMLSTIVEEPDATCMLVEVIAKNSQNIERKATIDWDSMTKKNIRRVSIDKFYSLVTWDEYAFSSLCKILPTVISDVISEIWNDISTNTVLSELQEISDDILVSIYKLSFWRYDWFKNMKISS